MNTFRLACSELKLERRLDRARSADLIDRVETAARPAGPQTVRQRLCRAAEQRAGQAVVGIAEVGVVEDVEELASETKSHLLGDVKDPLHPDIRLRRAEAAQDVASERTLLPGGRCSKSCSV